MQRRYRFLVTPEYQGHTIQGYLKHRLPEFLPETIRKMLYSGLVRINQETVIDIDSRIHAEDQIQISLDNEGRYSGGQYPLEILYENEDFVVVNKPSGIAAIPEKWDHKAALKTAVADYLCRQGQSKYPPRIVYRLDKEASGIVVAAKAPHIYQRLQQGLAARRVQLEYLALVAGIPQEDGKIELKIAQVARRSTRLKVSEVGKATVSQYRILEKFRDFALLAVNTDMENSHPLRLHLASLGHPLAVDPIYGYRDLINLSDLKDRYRPKKGVLEKPIISRLTLHANRIDFDCPDHPLGIQAPLPEDFEIALKMLRKYR